MAWSRHSKGVLMTALGLWMIPILNLNKESSHFPKHMSQVYASYHDANHL